MRATGTLLDIAEHVVNKKLMLRWKRRGASRGGNEFESIPSDTEVQKGLGWNVSS